MDTCSVVQIASSGAFFVTDALGCGNAFKSRQQFDLLCSRFNSRSCSLDLSELSSTTRTVSSIYARVLPTAWSCASTMRSSLPTIASGETDFGAESVTSRSGRCWISPSGPRRSSRSPSGTLSSGIWRKVSGSTGPENPSASAPLPAQRLASRCGRLSFA